MSIQLEICKSIPMGMFLGAMGGIAIELIRQLELEERPLKLDFNDDDERTDLLNLYNKRDKNLNFENFVL